MPYIVVENMSAGVDRRRPIYASKQGSLWEGINGHLSRGGDFEKRKAFVSTYTLPAGTFGLQTVGSSVIVFGGTAIAPANMPAGVGYVGLVHPFGVAMSDILWSELFDGKIYVIAEYSDGAILHFYDSVIIDDWINGTIAKWLTTNTNIASLFAYLIKAKMAGYSASASGAVVTLTGPIGVDYTIAASASNGGIVDNQAVALATTQASVDSGTEVLATGSFVVTRTLSTYPYYVDGPSYYGQPTFIEVAAPEYSYVSVKVDGVQLLPSATTLFQGPYTATQYAAAIAAAINDNVSTPDYTATSSGSTVTISAKPGTGTGPNGFVVLPESTAPSGGYGVVTTFSTIANMAGGSAGTADAGKITTITFSGTVENLDKFVLTIAGTELGYEAGNPPFTGEVAMTYKNKMYVIANSLLPFSKIGDPTKWNSDVDTGAGYINISNQDEGSINLTALSLYQGQVVVFSPNTIQLWYVESDDDNNILMQTVRRTGTKSPGSVQSFGDLDVFYLDNSGVRSLSATAQGNMVSVNDVGTLIDQLVQEWLADMTAAEIEKIRSIVEPGDGRYWLAIDDKILVFSYFPGSKISGWTWYEPGFSPEWFADPNDDTGVLVRSGDVIYKYGGADNETYDSSEATCWLPFMDAGKPGHLKDWTAVDAMVENTWDLELLNDPNDLSRAVQCGDVAGYTPIKDDTGALGYFHSLSPRLTCDAAGAASVSALVMYYLLADSEADSE